jgi:predicted homoserine dehydrogenase-like protein
VIGSRKGFLDHNPDRQAMLDWSARHGLRLNQTVAFTDGTKVQIEQALIANGLAADIATQGLVGPQSDGLITGAARLAGLARKHGRPLSDYVLAPGGRGEVFVVASHDSESAAELAYFRMGDGPDYLLVRPFHLGHFEIVKTVRRLLDGRPPLLDNGAHPRVGVAAVAKRDLAPGARIDRGTGSFDLRGIAVDIADFPDHVPIGLVRDCELRSAVEAGQLLTMSDVSLPETLARRAWESLRETSLAGSRHRPRQVGRGPASEL